MLYREPVDHLLLRITVFAFLLLGNLTASAQEKIPPTFKLFIIGDAGESEKAGPTLQDLKIKLLENPNSAVLFLGDNCYKKILFGLVDVERKGFDGGKSTREKIMAQLNILKEYKGSAWFIPGNHDWWNCISIKKGKKHLLAEELFIRDSIRNFTSLINHSDAAFYPKNGEAGPVSTEINNAKITIIFIDTYRLILEEIKGKRKNVEILNVFFRELEDQLKKASEKQHKIIIAAHHPINSKGKHSQSLKLSHKLVRRFANSNLNYYANKKVAVHIDSLLKTYNNSGIYYVSGHEHALEYFFKDNITYIVSGSGSKTDKVNLESIQTDNEFCKWNAEGFFEINFLDDHDQVLMHSRKDGKSPLNIDCLRGCNK